MKTIKTKFTIYVQLLLMHVIMEIFDLHCPLLLQHLFRKMKVRELSPRKPEIILDAPMMDQCSQFSYFVKISFLSSVPNGMILILIIHSAIFDILTILLHFTNLLINTFTLHILFF